jgi:hypothetical protein
VLHSYYEDGLLHVSGAQASFQEKTWSSVRNNDTIYACKFQVIVVFYELQWVNATVQ